MIVLSSPSGAGKTTLVKMLSKTDNFEVSISHTTRQPRPNEISDKDYYFVNEEEFKRLIKNEEFLEYAKVFNNFYGSTRTPVIDKLNKGKNILLHPPPSAASLVSPLCALTHCPQALRSPLSHAACHVASSGLARRVGALPIPARPPSIPRTACFSSRARGGVAIATGAAVVLPIHSDGTALRVLLKLPPACAQPSHTITLHNACSVR